MFGRRKDGRQIKVDPIMRLNPYFMSKRSDATNYCKLRIKCDGLDEYIRVTREKYGIAFSYFDIINAAIIRTMAIRKGLNRFVNRGRVYQRDKIVMSFIVKKGLKDHCTETSARAEFFGHESCFEVKTEIEKLIEENSAAQAGNDVDKVINLLAKMPSFLLRFLVGTAKLLDKYNMLPKMLLDLSPFHNSFMTTNLKSIKWDYIYHHCYNFGTTGIFISIGKEQYEPVVEDGKVIPAKTLTFGIAADERFCDGLYFVTSLKLLSKYLEDPAQLEEEYYDKEITSEIIKARAKRIKKAKKNKNKPVPIVG